MSIGAKTVIIYTNGTVVFPGLDYEGRKLTVHERSGDVLVVHITGGSCWGGVGMRSYDREARKGDAMVVVDSVIDMLVDDAEFYELPSNMDTIVLPVGFFRRRLHAVGNDWDRLAADVANIKRISRAHNIDDSWYHEVLWPDGTEDREPHTQFDRGRR